jgi:hypothetical protein
MYIVVEYPDATGVVTNEFQCKRECARRIDLVVAKNIVMQRASLEDLALKGNVDCYNLFVSLGKSEFVKPSHFAPRGERRPLSPACTPLGVDPGSASYRPAAGPARFLIRLVPLGWRAAMRPFADRDPADRAVQAAAFRD